MASATRWTWVWVSSGSWWWTGKPGVLQSMGSQRVSQDWVAELTVSYKLWEYYLDSRTLGFLICKMEMMIICISKYFRKTYERCEHAKASEIQKMSSFLVFFTVPKELGEIRLALWKQGELWEHETGKYWVKEAEKVSLERWCLTWDLEDVWKLHEEGVGVCCWSHGGVY